MLLAGLEVALILRMSSSASRIPLWVPLPSLYPFKPCSISGCAEPLIAQKLVLRITFGQRFGHYRCDWCERIPQLLGAPLQ